MPGVGQELLPLPRPSFSSENPFWRIPQIEGIKKEYRPRLSARTFLYACTWELWRRDWFGANCVRRAMERTFWLNLRFVKINLKKENVAYEKVS